MCIYKNIFQSILFLQQAHSKDFFYLLFIYGRVPIEPQNWLKDLHTVVYVQGKNLVGCFAVNRAKIFLTRLSPPPCKSHCNMSLWVYWQAYLPLQVGH